MSKETAVLGEAQTDEGQTEGAEAASGAAADASAQTSAAGAASDAKAKTTETAKATETDADKAFQAKLDEAIKARDAKAEGEKKTAAEKAKADYEKAWGSFKPEGKRDEETLKEFTALAKEAGLKPEQATKFLALSDKLDAARAKANAAALDEEAQGWVKALRADKEFGGAKYTETLKLANKVYEEVADAETTKFLTETKLNLHPGLLKMFARLGARMKGDTIAGTLGTSTGTPSREDQLKKLYPSMFPKS